MADPESGRAPNDVAPHEHCVIVYDDHEDVLESLETFVRRGMEQNENATFVHAFDSVEDARRFAARANLDADKLQEQGHLDLNHYREVLEGGAERIDREHVEAVMNALVDAAEREGRAGPRVFVDASRRYFDAGRVEEWLDFEEWLGPRLHARCGLVCAYRRSDLQRPGVLARVLKAHAYRFGARAP